MILRILGLSGILLCVCLTACAPKAHTLYLQGSEAYQQKHYQTAFALLLKSADYGDPYAEYAVGYMYYYGIGVDRNKLLGVKYLKKSDSHHFKKAHKALIAIKKGVLPIPILT